MYLYYTTFLRKNQNPENDRIFVYIPFFKIIFLAVFEVQHLVLRAGLFIGDVISFGGAGDWL